MSNSAPVKGISIIICCYNSAPRLPTTLAYVASQRVPEDIPWEVIVVDNASQDGTAAIAIQSWQQNGCSAPLQVVKELLPGLNFARLKGFHTAKYDFMLLVDDDNWLNEDYIRLAYEVMESEEQIGMLGGLGMATFEGAPPAWFASFEAAYAVGPQWKQSGPLPMDCGYIYGAGSIIRKSAWTLLNEKGFTTLATDRKGNELSAGGDIELGDALRLAGFFLWYDDRLKFRHFMPKERLTWSYLMRLGEGTARSALPSIIYYFVFRHPNLSEGRFCYLYYKRLVWLFLQLMRGPIRVFRAVVFRNDERYPSNFETWRTICNFKMSFIQVRQAVKAFKQINNFKRKVSEELF